MKTHPIILLIISTVSTSLFGSEYTATPDSFYNCQMNAQSGDTILMEPGIYHGEWEWFSKDGITWGWVWKPVIDPNGRNIVYKKDPNFSGEVILSGLVPPSPPSPPDDVRLFRPPCQIKSGEGNSCQVIGLTIRCGPEDINDFCDNYGWMGIECWDSSPLIKDCNFVDFPQYPEPHYHGCGIDITNTNGRLVVQSCRFIDINDGGIGMAGNVNVQINDCTLSCINAAYYGIYASTNSGSIVEINNCDISNFGQGGISIALAETTISDCNIINNTGSEGGGIFCNSDSLLVRRCNIIGNSAGNIGGGIYPSCTATTIEDCNITGNTAADGGGIYCDSTSANLVLRRCRIENNTANGYAMGGGGIMSWAYLNAEHCIIRGNVTDPGGAGGGIHAFDANIINCVINNNRTGGDGGGIYLANPPHNASFLYNCTIRGNEANGIGGGSFFMHMDSGYGPIPINITNCIFWGNADTEDTPGYQRRHQIYTCPYPNINLVNLRNCDIESTSTNSNSVFDDNVIPGDYDDFNIIGKNLGGNINNDPCFADDYHLIFSSPCINAGYNNVVFWGYDIDGEQRIIGGIVDIGADEAGAPPVSSWLFNETSGLVVYDSSGHGYDGNIIDATRINDPVRGWCLSFDGTDDYVSIPDEPNLNITGEITISAWIYLENGGGSEQGIVTKTVDNGATDNPFDFRTEGGYLTLVRADGEDDDYVYSTQQVPTNRWHHVLVKVDSNNVPDFYIDGVVTGKTVDSFTRTPTGNTNPVLIGNRDDGLYFKGFISDVLIYNRALSDTEIQELYWGGLSCKASLPNPADGATGVDVNVTLSWSPGKDAVTHDVYFGTDFNEINDADINYYDVYMGRQDANYWDTSNYNSNGLDFYTTYYWRVDEVTASATTKGDVWAFQTPILVDWWKFDEGTGNIVYDSAGTHNGYVYGATWTTGQINGALSFDGIDDSVYFSGVNHDNITVSAWMKTSTQGALVSNHYTSSGYGTWYTLFSNAIEIGDNSQGGYKYVYFNTNDNNTLDDAWHHIVYTKNGTNHAIYVDGSLNQQFTSNADINNGSMPTYIGKKWNYSGGWFNGKIDDVRIYNGALSATEVSQLYQNGS